MPPPSYTPTSLLLCWGQAITQHAFNEDKDDGWVDLDISLMVVVRLDRQHVVAQAETKIGLGQSGTSREGSVLCA